eukprot:g79337.t1
MWRTLFRLQSWIGVAIFYISCIYIRRGSRETAAGGALKLGEGAAPAAVAKFPCTAKMLAAHISPRDVTSPAAYDMWRCSPPAACFRVVLALRWSRALKQELGLLFLR